MVDQFHEALLQIISSSCVQLSVLPLLRMEDNSWPIMRLAGEGSVTRGSTCMVTREGKSLNTDALTAL